MQVTLKVLAVVVLLVALAIGGSLCCGVGVELDRSPPTLGQCRKVFADEARRILGDAEKTARIHSGMQRKGYVLIKSGYVLHSKVGYCAQQKALFDLLHTPDGSLTLPANQETVIRAFRALYPQWVTTYTTECQK